MANEQRSEAAEPPFWSSMWDRANTGVALADRYWGNPLAATAGAVNSVVGPLVNPFLPEGSKLETTFGGVMERQEDALKDAPRDFRAIAEEFPHPGSMAGLAQDAGQAMLLFALPAMKRLEKAGLLPSTGPGSQEALDQVNRFRTSDKPRPESEILHDWERGFARTSDFWGSSPERRRSDDLLLYLPSQDFRLKQDLADGYTTDGKVQDLFHLNPQIAAAMPPGMGESRAVLRPVPGMSLADADGSAGYDIPSTMTDRELKRLGYANWSSPDGRVFANSEITATAPPGAVEGIMAHEFLGHGPQMTEPGSSYLTNHMIPSSAKLLDFNAVESPAIGVLGREHRRLGNELYEVEGKALNPMSAGPEADDIRREMGGIDRKLGELRDFTNYHDKPQERWARWVQAQHGMSLDDVRPPGLNDDFFSTDFIEARSDQMSGLPFIYHRPAPFDESD